MEKKREAERRSDGKWHQAGDTSGVQESRAFLAFALECGSRTEEEAQLVAKDGDPPTTTRSGLVLMTGLDDSETGLGQGRLLGSKFWLI